jgi:hypothetical protein
MLGCMWHIYYLGVSSEQQMLTYAQMWIIVCVIINILYLLSATYRTLPSVQWVPEVLSPAVKRSRGVTLTTHPHLVPRS